MIDPKVQQEKVKRFMADKLMQESVYEVLLDSFMKPVRENDVHWLAASRIAIDLLQAGWKDLEQLQDKKDTETQPLVQVGM